MAAAGALVRLDQIQEKCCNWENARWSLSGYVFQVNALVGRSALACLHKTSREISQLPVQWLTPQVQATDS